MKLLSPVTRLFSAVGAEMYEESHAAEIARAAQPKPKRAKLPRVGDAVTCRFWDPSTRAYRGEVWYGTVVEVNRKRPGGRKVRVRMSTANSETWVSAKEIVG